MTASASGASEGARVHRIHQRQPADARLAGLHARSEPGCPEALSTVIGSGPTAQNLRRLAARVVRQCDWLTQRVAGLPQSEGAGRQHCCLVTSRRSALSTRPLLQFGWLAA